MTNHLKENAINAMEEAIQQCLTARENNDPDMLRDAVQWALVASATGGVPIPVEIAHIICTTLQEYNSKKNPPFLLQNPPKLEGAPRKGHKSRPRSLEEHRRMLEAVVLYQAAPKGGKSEALKNLGIDRDYEKLGRWQDIIAKEGLRPFMYLELCMAGEDLSLVFPALGKDKKFTNS